MKVFLSLYFFMIAIVQFGILLGIYHYFRSSNAVKPSRYWISSLLANVISLVLFGTGVLIVEDLSTPPLSFTFSNSLLYTASVLQTLFCISLSRKIKKQTEIIFIASILIFIPFFEYLRQAADFEIRTIFMAACVSLLYFLQIYEIKQCRNSNPSKQLLYLQLVTIIEVICAAGRIIAIAINDMGTRHFEQIPQILVLTTLAQLVMNTLSYISIAGYWAEMISFSNAIHIAENRANEKKLAEITELLREKEKLVYGLLKANKTATTGALSVSISHELNQPLAASTLNIQLLKRVLSGTPVKTDACTDIVNALENDTRRASTIVKSLRSIFTDDKTQIEIIDVSDVFSDVLAITKSETDGKNIQIELSIEPELKLRMNPGEIRQVLFNLLSNAIHALSGSNNLPKTITIEARKMNSHIRITIADNGHGITKEFQPNLFELLSTTKETGMGLGLWLCKHIITRHNGSIQFEEGRPGAKFIIKLPLAA